METSSCPGVLFSGKSAEAAGGAALEWASTPLPNLKAKLNIFAVAKCRTRARLKCFQREQLLQDGPWTALGRICL